MLILKLAYRNLAGAGLRTWLNVLVLSLCYFLIIFLQGFYQGALIQGSHDRMNDEIGGGEYWCKNYDPYDPITLDDSHSAVPREIEGLIENNKAAAILIRQASIFPNGRLETVLMKGIAPEQKILSIPTHMLGTGGGDLPVLLGERMAKKNSLKTGDSVTVRFRDSNGTFEAVDGEIAGIINTNVPTIDKGQLWVSLEAMRKFTSLKGQATIVVVSQDTRQTPAVKGWDFKTTDFLLADLKALIRSKTVGSSIILIILLFLAVIAVFDTQILSIFRRRREIGTLIALGMTKFRVIMLFTLEGAMNGIMAAALAAIYGTPFLYYLARYGIRIPIDTGSFGIAIASRLYPAYSAGLILTTAIIVMGTVTVVSYLPTRNIARLRPTEALKGKTS